MPVIYGHPQQPRKLQINLYFVNGRYEIELINLDAPIDQQRRGVSPGLAKAPRIFTTDLELQELIPAIIKVNGRGDFDVVDCRDPEYQSVGSKP